VTKLVEVKLGGRNSVSITLQPLEGTTRVPFTERFPFSL